MFWNTKKPVETVAPVKEKSTCYQSEKICIEDNIASLNAAKWRIEEDLMKIKKEQENLIALEKAGRHALCTIADYCKSK